MAVGGSLVRIITDHRFPPGALAAVHFTEAIPFARREMSGFPALERTFWITLEVSDSFSPLSPEF